MELESDITCDAQTTKGKTAMKSLLLPVFSVAICLGALCVAAKPEQPLEVKPPQDVIAFLTPTQGNAVRGVIVLKRDDDCVHITGEVCGLSPGKHGFHIHNFRDLRATDGSSAGGHYSPRGHKHGGPDAREHHAGDLGNIVANDRGVAVVDKTSKDFKLQFVVGRAVVVHAGADDLTSHPSGDAGPRVALGVIGLANVKDSARVAASQPDENRSGH
jgi:Cu-Zn family superoxide dismutase